MPKKISTKGLIKKLDDIVRVKVRARDNNTCQWCGKYITGFDSQVSHTIPKGRCLYLRWDLQNVILLCAFCHNEKWHKRSLGRVWFDAKYPDRAKYVEEHEHEIVRRTSFIEETYQKCLTDQT